MTAEMIDMCSTGPRQTLCEPGTHTLLFHWWRPARRVKPTPYDRLCACPGALRTMHLRHLRGSRQKPDAEVSMHPCARSRRVTPTVIASLWVEYSGSSLEAIPTDCPLVPFGLLEVSDPCKVTKALASIRSLAVTVGRDPSAQIQMNLRSLGKDIAKCSPWG